MSFVFGASMAIARAYGMSRCVHDGLRWFILLKSLSRDTRMEQPILNTLCFFPHAFLHQRSPTPSAAAGGWVPPRKQEPGPHPALAPRSTRAPEGPRASKGCVADRQLHGDGVQAPPATDPCCSRRGPHAWWGAVRAEGDHAEPASPHPRATALPPRNRGRIGPRLCAPPATNSG